MKDEMFKSLLNVNGITDDIMIVGYGPDSGDHDRTERWVTKIWK